MKRLYDAASTVRSALLCQSSNQRAARAARKLDPIVRDALAITLQDNNCLVELEELESELAQVKDGLEQAMNKEQFLGLRSRHYRQVLDSTARKLHDDRVELKAKEPLSSQNTNDRDEEADAVYTGSLLDWEKRMEKWEKDQDALKAIQTTHTGILATIEEMRRTIRKLEQKKATVQKLSDQCQEFVSAVATTADDRVATGEALNEGEVVEAANVVKSPLCPSLAEDSSPEIVMENTTDDAVDTAERGR